MLFFCFFGKKKPKTDSLKTSNYTIFVSPTSMDNISHWTFDLQLYFNSILTFHLPVNLYPFKNQPFALYNKQYYLSLGENNMEKKTIDQAKVHSYIDHLQNQTHEKMMEHLKAFNDGVFAIIITILALEIPAPHSQAAYPAFIKSISIFLISFFVIGNFWYHLTLLLSNIKQAPKRVIIVDLMYLADLTLLPVLTSWIIEKPSALAVANYGIVYLIAQLVRTWLHHIVFSIHISSALPAERAAIIEDHTDRQMRLRTVLLFILNGSLIALALLNPKLTIYAYLALPILDFFLPSHQKLIKKIKR